MIVSVHQPNLFPWLGYFDKISKSDTFILLDDAQFPKGNALWINRVYCLINNEKKWLTIPVDRKYSGVKAIKDISLDQKNNWRPKLEKQLFFTYKKCAHFEEVMPWIENALNTTETLLSVFNEKIILDLVNRFGLTHVNIIKSSELNVDGLSNERLINLAKSVDADTYLCGDGSQGYLDETVFEQNDINIVYQQFQHPVYDQRNTKEFIGGLSVIDVLMNLGFEGTKTIIHDQKKSF